MFVCIVSSAQSVVFIYVEINLPGLDYPLWDVVYLRYKEPFKNLPLLERPMVTDAVVVSMFDFHRSDRGSNPVVAVKFHVYAERHPCPSQLSENHGFTHAM